MCVLWRAVSFSSGTATNKTEFFLIRACVSVCVGMYHVAEKEIRVQKPGSDPASHQRAHPCGPNASTIIRESRQTFTHKKTHRRQDARVCVCVRTIVR